MLRSTRDKGTISILEKLKQNMPGRPGSSIPGVTEDMLSLDMVSEPAEEEVPPRERRRRRRRRGDNPELLDELSRSLSLESLE